MASSEAYPVIWEHRCKLCNLAKSYPELFKEVHFQVIEVGMSMNRVMNMINRRIELEGIKDVGPFNNQNFGVHFASHITLPDKVSNELNRLGSGQQPLVEVNAEAGNYVEDLVRRKVGNEVNDYLNLDQLRAMMMEKLEILNDIVARKSEDGKEFVDLEAMTVFTSTIREIRATITDINKIRSSKQVMNVVIKSLIQKQTHEVVNRLSREYDQVRRDLLDANVPDNIVIQIDQSLRMRLAQIVAETASKVLEETIRAYRLN